MPAAQPPSPETIERLRRSARLLDTAFVIPGTGVRFGLDALLGLLPVAGDTASFVLGLAPVLAARRWGLGRGLILRMLGNLALDWLVGLVPLLDLVFDVTFRANIRNLRLLERALERAAASSGSGPGG